VCVAVCVAVCAAVCVAVSTAESDKTAEKHEANATVTSKLMCTRTIKQTLQNGMRLLRMSYDL